MPRDPWEVSSEEGFDLADCFEDQVVPPTPYIQASPGWITKAKVRAHAYQSLRASDTVQPHLGLDRSLGQVRIDDVCSLPVDRDEGYATAEQTGQGPNYPAIIQCLLQFQTRIWGKDMIYLMVDNRDPGDVPHWPAFEKWWLSRCRLVGPHHEYTDVFGKLQTLHKLLSDTRTLFSH